MAFVYWIRAPHHTDMFTEGYVGFTSTSVQKRIRTHRTDSKRDKCKNYPVYRAFEKYGDSLVIETVVEGSSEYCLDLEKKLRPKQRLGWNLNVGGEKASLGTRRSKESCSKQSKTMTGMVRSKSHCDSLSKALTGLKKTPEHLAKIVANRVPQTLWRNPRTNPYFWYVADIVYAGIKYNWKICDIESGVHLSSGMLATVIKNIRKGWNPSEDPEWLKFKASYEESQHVKTK